MPRSKYDTFNIEFQTGKEEREDFSSEKKKKGERERQRISVSGFNVWVFSHLTIAQMHASRFAKLIKANIISPGFKYPTPILTSVTTVCDSANETAITHFTFMNIFYGHRRIQTAVCDLCEYVNVVLRIANS